MKHFLKKISLFLFFLFLCFRGWAQTIEPQNAWIDYGKIYLQIEITEDGIYKITYDELKKAGLTSFKNIGLEHHGKNVALEAINEKEGVLAENGYILFYAEKNKGLLDSLVYAPSEKRNNPYHSLFSDVSVYFISNFEKLPPRVEQVILTEKSTENTFKEELVYAPNAQYSFNNSIGLLPNVMQSYYEAGEGWTGKFMSADSVANFAFSLKDFIPKNPLKLDLKLNGRSLTNHAFNLAINGLNVGENIEIEPFGAVEKRFEIQNPNSNVVNLQFTPKLSQKFDWYSITYATFSYARLFNNELIDRSFRVYKSVYFSPKAVASWDITNLNSPKKIIGISSSTLSYSFQGSLLFNCSSFKSPNKISSITFKKLPTDFNYLIITDPLLESASIAYSNYRKSMAGGNHKTAIVFTEDIYKQFFYGEKSPMAIYNYLKYSVIDRKKTNLLLIGKATTFPDVLKSGPDMVPSFGYPASDLMLGTGPDYSKQFDWIPTGRISASTNTEILAYLDKVKEHEADLATEWRKNGLHISGGQNSFELFYLKNILENLEPKLETQGLRTGLKTLNKPNDNLVEQVDISNEVNKGLGFITYTGHGSTSELDYNFGFCSDPKRNINNTGKYPFMFFNGCGVGNVFYRYNVLSTDWLLTPKKGAIAVLANSYWSYSSSTQQYLNELYGTLFENKLTIGKSIGEAQIAVLNELQNGVSDPYLRSAIHQVVLQGDPALKLFPFEKAEYAVQTDGIFFQSYDGIKSIASSDSIVINAIIENFGLYDASKTLTLTTKIAWKNGSETTLTKSFSAFPRKNICQMVSKNNGQILNIETQIDPQNQVLEYSKTNNYQKLKLVDDWGKIGSIAIFPENSLADIVAPTLEVLFDGRLLKNKGIIASNASLSLTLTDERTLKPLQTELLEVFIQKCPTCVPEKIEISKFALTQVGATKITLNLYDINLPAGEYTLLIKAKDNANNSPGRVFEKQFRILAQAEKNILEVTPNPVQTEIVANLKIGTLKNPVSGTAFLINQKGEILAQKMISPKTGENIIVLPRRKEYAAGTYFLKIEVKLDLGKSEFLGQKIILN
jgi:Peptidase family C25